MNPKIKELIEELRRLEFEEAGYNNIAITRPVGRAASILQAVFDPENQPSQYGTTLLPK